MKSTSVQRPKIIGLSASLRNARFGAGSEQLVEDLASLNTKDELVRYLREQSKICVEDFVKAGREEGASFDAIYTNLLKRKGDQGLSNSEVALAAGLWGAQNQDVDIEHVGLSQYFTDSETRNIEELVDQLLTCDGLLISGPIYFGDRSSLAHSFIELVRETPALREHLQGKVYAGISVGAKRNGGQETTLIYQMLDMANLGMLAVGNDSDTTSQYGGTCKGGDVGTAADDDYGINTSIGTGNRIGRVAWLIRYSQAARLKGPLRVSVWLLQDQAGKAAQQIQALTQRCASDDVEFKVMNFTDEYIRRCIACDICPTHVATDEEYRCIIKKPEDLFKRVHEELIDTDAVLLAAYSPRDYANLVSVYQKFMERTRYLRRGDYVYSDLVVAPLIMEEVGARENLHIRAMTSLIRHHTIMFAPMIGHILDDQLLIPDQLDAAVRAFCGYAATMTAGRLRRSQVEQEALASAYNPVGYVLSTEKDKEQETIRKREAAVTARNQAVLEDAAERLASV